MLMRCAMYANRATSNATMNKSHVLHAAKGMLTSRTSSISDVYVQLALAASDGIVTIRTVLSALPEISLSDVGLKHNVVGGKSCAFKMLNCGCRRVDM